MAGGGSKPGERRGGRKRGTPNKQSAEMRDAIQRAAVLEGEAIKDGDPDGLVAYMRDLAKNHKAIFGPILAKCIPSEVKIKADGPLVVVRDFARTE